MIASVKNSPAEKLLKLVIVLSAVVACLNSSIGLADEKAPPNIVVFLVDDLGQMDIGANNPNCFYETKHVDALAASGLRFTNGYAANPVCSPTRYSLMTGKYPTRVRATNFFSGKRSAKFNPAPLNNRMPLDEITLAQLAKQKGYATFFAGKWHLGPEPEYFPQNRGFDVNIGGHTAGGPYSGKRYFAPFKNPEIKVESPAGDHLPDRLARETAKFIDQNKSKPFFLYYATTVPHVALQVPEDSLQEYEGEFEETPYLGNKGYTPHPKPRAAYAAMITRMDRNVGRILAKLESHGLADNTIVMFSSDNGPTYAGGVDHKFFQSAGPLRGLKGSTFEGGLRVPMIARWPGKIKAGSVTEHVSAFQDVLPTVCELSGGKTPDSTDGISFLPTLVGKDSNQKQHEHLYWELKLQQSVRAGKWKLYRKANKKGKIKQQLLFDLESDLGETTDLSETHPDDLKRMLSIARAARFPSKQFPSPFDKTTD